MGVSDKAPQLPPLAALAPLPGAERAPTSSSAAAATAAPVPGTKKSERIPPPTPPGIIKDVGRGISYRRAGFLGEVSTLTISRKTSVID